jgi:hypothetical protein
LVRRSVGELAGRTVDPFESAIDICTDARAYIN